MPSNKMNRCKYIWFIKTLSHADFPFMWNKSVFPSTSMEMCECSWNVTLVIDEWIIANTTDGQISFIVIISKQRGIIITFRNEVKEKGKWSWVIVIENMWSFRKIW